MKTILRLTALVSLCAVVGLTAGCASNPKEAKSDAPKEEYVTVMTTGSNIPVRIKKSDLEKGTVPKGVLAPGMSSEEFKKMQQPTATPNRGG